MSDLPYHCFISYAREDLESAQKLYLDLRHAGLRPWMDRPPAPYQNSGLLPGEAWEAKIRRVLNNSKLAILLFSKKSVGKAGFVQTEFRQALIKLARMPQGQVGIIPVRLENCDIPEHRIDGVSFGEYQWVDCFDLDFTGIVESVTHHAGDIPSVPVGETLDFPSSEFVDAFASNAKRRLRGIYDLSLPDEKIRKHAFVEDVYDGRQFVFRDIDDVELVARPPGSASIVVKPRYAAVLEMRECRRVSIRGVNFGHTDGSGFCTGPVIRLSSCQDLVFEDCSLHGSGTFAFEISNCSRIRFEGCRMYGCTYGVAEIRSCVGVTVDSCEIFENRGFGGFVCFNSDLSLDQCVMHSNKFESHTLVHPHFASHESNIIVRRTKISLGREGSLEGFGKTLFEDCSISDDGGFSW